MNCLFEFFFLIIYLRIGKIREREREEKNAKTKISFNVQAVN